MGELFVWDEKYSTGNKEVDAHHQHLFNILNRLYEICSVTQDMDALGKVIDELARYADYHFVEEEKYMRRKGHVDIRSHASQHEMFRTKVKQFQKQDRQDLVPARELVVYLGEWLLDHVLEADVKSVGGSSE